MSSSNKALREANKRLYEAFQAWAKEVGLSPNITDGDVVKQHFVSEDGVSHPLSGHTVSCTHPIEPFPIRVYTGPDLPKLPNDPLGYRELSRISQMTEKEISLMDTLCKEERYASMVREAQSVLLGIMNRSVQPEQAKRGYLHSDGITLLTPCEPTDNQAALHYLKNGRWHRVHYQFVDGERSRFIRMYLGGEIVRVYLTEAMPDDFGYFFDPLRPYTPIDYKDRTRTRMPNLSDDGAVLMGRGVDGLWYNARKAFPEEDDTNAYCLYKDDPNYLVGVVPADKIRAFVDID